MKNVISLFFCFFAAVKSVAQNPQLFNSTWFLQEIVIDQAAFYPPIPNPHANLVFSETSFNIIHPACEEIMFNDIQYSGGDSFSLIQGGFLLGTGCSPAAEAFYTKHYAIYFENGNVAINPFSYTISNSGNQILLIITNADGDQAFYGNQELANADFSQPAFVVYSNPTHDVLAFSGLEQREIVSATLYDVSGKLLFTPIIDWNSSTIDVSGLSNGIYFLEVRTKNGNTFNRKFVKG